MKIKFNDDSPLIFCMSLMCGVFGNVIIALIMMELDLPTVFDLGFFGLLSICLGSGVVIGLILSINFTTTLHNHRLCKNCNKILGKQFHSIPCIVYYFKRGLQNYPNGSTK